MNPGNLDHLNYRASIELLPRSQPSRPLRRIQQHEAGFLKPYAADHRRGLVATRDKRLGFHICSIELRTRRRQSGYGHNQDPSKVDIRRCSGLCLKLHAGRVSMTSHRLADGRGISYGFPMEVSPNYSRWFPSHASLLRELLQSESANSAERRADPRFC